MAGWEWVGETATEPTGGVKLRILGGGEAVGFSVGGGFVGEGRSWD